MVAHISSWVARARKWDNEVTAFTPSSVQGQQDTVKKKDHQTQSRILDPVLHVYWHTQNIYIFNASHLISKV